MMKILEELIGTEWPKGTKVFNDKRDIFEPIFIDNSGDYIGKDKLGICSFWSSDLTRWQLYEEQKVTLYRYLYICADGSILESGWSSNVHKGTLNGYKILKTFTKEVTYKEEE